MLVVLGVTEPTVVRERRKKRFGDFKEVFSTTLVRDGATRFMFLNLGAPCPLAKYDPENFFHMNRNIRPAR